VWALTPAVIATVVPPIRPGASTPTDYGIDARSVEYETADGVTIRAWYSPSTNGATVILRHGAGSDASTVLPQAGVLAGHGFGLLVTDARGHGRSEGRAMEFGWFGDLDIGAGVDFLTAQPEFDAGQIAVVGMSMGGEEAIGAIGSDPRIAAVVAEGATARTDADKRWLAEEYGFRGRVQLGLEWVQYGLTDLFTDASKPSPLATAAHTASPRPLLLIAGGEMADEVKVVEYLAAESGDNVSIWTVTDSGHIQGLATDPAAWEERVVGFLETALIQGG
jgi:pimeloyl-ACP methyl ester carboxylesterase